MQTDGNDPVPRLTWIKGEGVGPFKFGAKLEMSAWALEGAPERVSATLSEVSYRVKGCREAYVYSNGGLISSVSSHSVFLIGGVNIIGGTVGRAIQVLGQEPDESETERVIDGEQSVFYFYGLGLMLWVLDDDVVTVQAGPAF